MDCKSLQSVLPKSRSGLILDDIKVVKTSDRLITAMRTTFKNTKDISGLRISKYGVNGHYVEDAYIYRLNKTKN